MLCRMDQLAERQRFEQAVSLSYDVLAARNGQKTVVASALRGLLTTVSQGSVRSFRSSLERLLICRSQCTQAFPDMVDARINEFIAEADSDGDGTISRKEFLKFCTVCDSALRMLWVGQLLC